MSLPFEQLPEGVLVVLRLPERAALMLDLLAGDQVIDYSHREIERLIERKPDLQPVPNQPRSAVLSLPSPCVASAFFVSVATSRFEPLITVSLSACPSVPTSSSP